MAIKIEVNSSDISIKSGTSARTGKPYNIREQDAWAHVTDRDGKPQPYPVRIRMMLGDDQQPYPVGVYSLSDASFWVDRFGSLSLSPVLVPVGVAPAVPAAAKVA